MKRPQTLYIITGAALIFAFLLCIYTLLRTGLPSADVIAREAANRPVIKVTDFTPGDAKIIRLNDLRVIVWRRNKTDQKLAASQNTPEVWRLKYSTILGRPEPVFADNANLTFDHEWFFALAEFPAKFQYIMLRAGDFEGFFEGHYAAHFDLSGRIRKGVGSSNLTVIGAEYVDNGQSIQLNLSGNP